MDTWTTFFFFENLLKAFGKDPDLHIFNLDYIGLIDVAVDDRITCHNSHISFALVTSIKRVPGIFILP